ncbi:class F sortase [Streptomyces sp. RFCAC02]|uniref:class F sortase n=1 Tax=Streptomyces sp. RFCAC02 TaxID=2499143 RepID=UPI00101F54E3|nr:class F sortase [Streptomyces sp. RFCAC02]
MRGRLLAAATWALLLTGVWLWGRALTEDGGAAARPAHEAVSDRGAGAGADALPPAARPLPGAAPPARVEIAALGVDAEVMERGVDEGGGVAPPPFDAPGAVGWYADGATPGAAGPAILVGHVDTTEEPAVFYRLRELVRGDTVRVTRQDGSVAEFTVREVTEVPREAFDAREVYGPRTPGEAELRLITCGGGFDPAAGGYAANVVVDAYLTGTAAAQETV